MLRLDTSKHSKSHHASGPGWLGRATTDSGSESSGFGVCCDFLAEKSKRTCGRWRCQLLV
eukprot:1526103-Rhodomonas_salina.1